MSRPLGARRKLPEERRADMIAVAAAIAIDHGLERVTAKRVAEELGVYPGLVSHYFTTADDLVAVAFAHGVSAERSEIFDMAPGAPLRQMRHVLSAWLDPARDPVSLLWLDGWQASRRRPALAEAVAVQMAADVDRLSSCIRRGVDAGEFRVDAPGDAALQILCLVDGNSVQAATRATLDYRVVHEMVIATAERILGLDHGQLGLAPVGSAPPSAEQVRTARAGR